MSRLLTEEVFKIILPKVCRLRPEIDIKGAQQAQLLADEIVPLILKAVGKWIENKRAGRTMADGKMALVKEIPDENWVCFVTDEDVNTLKRGEMPEEVK